MLPVFPWHSKYLNSRIRTFYSFWYFSPSLTQYIFFPPFLSFGRGLQLAVLRAYSWLRTQSHSGGGDGAKWGTRDETRVNCVQVLAAVLLLWSWTHIFLTSSKLLLASLQSGTPFPTQVSMGSSNIPANPALLFMHTYSRALCFSNSPSTCGSPELA